jgi:pimeloyl-ACP methyl ester carboxylesterase
MFRRMLVFFAMTLAAASCFTMTAQAAGGSFRPGPVLSAEAKSKDLCEAVPDRIFVETDAGSECVAYFVTKGFETRRQAVFYFGGDAASFANEAAFRLGLQENLHYYEAFFQRWADQLRVRYVYVARLGLQGSSGNHSERAKPKETMVMNAATTLLKARLGLDSIALVGQSRGATIAASLLTLGRKDVTCAILGSGALSLVDLEYKQARSPAIKARMSKTLYDPASHVGSIEPDPMRRIFVLGDPADNLTPLAQQIQFAKSLKAAGHNAVAIEVDGDEHHGVSKWTIPAAGACLNNLTDDLIIRAVARGQLQHPLTGLRFQPGRWTPMMGKPASAAIAGGAPKS